MLKQLFKNIQKNFLYKLEFYLSTGIFIKIAHKLITFFTQDTVTYVLRTVQSFLLYCSMQVYMYSTIH